MYCLTDSIDLSPRYGGGRSASTSARLARAARIAPAKSAVAAGASAGGDPGGGDARQADAARSTDVRAVAREPRPDAGSVSAARRRMLGSLRAICNREDDIRSRT